MPNNLLHNCRENTQLSSQSLDRPLTVREWLQHRLHLLFCAACRRFLEQQLMLRRAIGRWVQSSD